MSEDNSTASPVPEHRYIPQAGLFYRVDSSRNTFVELWRDTRSPLVLIAWLSKLLRVKVPGSVNDPNVVSIRPFVVPLGDKNAAFPPEVMSAFAPIVRELTVLGFCNPVYFLIDDRFHSSRTIQIAFMHRDARAIVRVNHRTEGVQSKKTHFFTEFLSELPGNVFLHSSSAIAQLNAPPQCRLNWRPRTTTSQLWVSHREKLNETRQSATAVTIRNQSEVVDLLERHHEAVRDYHLRRGVFSSMRGEDLAQVQALDRNMVRAQDGQFQEPDVMAHLERLQQKRASLSNGLVVLIVSIGLFVGLGASTWAQPWHAILMIGGILFVHEAGHYLAMRVFKYRNVRMFFIPLFGAAVSGHNYSAPGWKRVVVAMMGPLPGIVIGSVLGVHSVIKGNDTLGTVAVMFIVLNGLQLIPVLPLDGGRVAHALIFSRHHSLDAIFHVVAGLVLVGLGLVFNDMLCWGLGILMFIGLPATWKVAKIARELRQTRLRPGSTSPVASLVASTEPVSFTTSAPTTSTIPQSAVASAKAPDSVQAASQVLDADSRTELMPRPIAEMVITKIRSRFHQIKNPRQIAQLALRVYEILLMRPPGILPSLGFGFLHAASLVVAFVMIGVIMIGRNPNWLRLVQANNINPTRIVDARGICEWESQHAAPTPGERDPPTNGGDGSAPVVHKTVVATFATMDQVGQAFDEVRRDAPPGAYAVQFGQSLLLTLPNSDLSMKWFDKFEGRADDVFVDDGDGSEAYFTLICLAADRRQATAIVDELSNFLDASESLQLIPPWVEGRIDTRSEEEHARNDDARAVLRKLTSLTVYDAPELALLRSDRQRASRRADRAEYNRLNAQLIEAQNELQIAKLKQVRDELLPNHRELADRYIALKAEEHEADRLMELDDDDGIEAWAAALARLNDRRRAELGPLLGQWPLGPNDEEPSPDAMRFQHRFGHAMLALSSRLVVTIQFNDASRGAPALVRWLDRRGCKQFRYEFGPGDVGLE